jgi:F420-dependent oxidoreductase-like protein
MIEGQEDVTWEDWVALAQACERHGIEALFRSDHYLSVAGAHDRGSLDAWATVCGLAAQTTTLRLGTLVSPATFRHPSVLAKMATTADHISGGRIEVGLGAGWMEAEHEMYGFPFAGLRTRMDVLAEQLEIVHRSWEPDEFSFAGEHYTINGLNAQPKPVQQPHPPLIMGGAAGKRATALAARWADEYNTAFATVEQARERRGIVEAACRDAGRDPLPFSLMNALVVGADRADVERRAAEVAALMGRDGDRATIVGEFAQQWIVGTVDEVVARLREYEEAGVERVFLQHLLHRDLDVVELIGRELVPALSS